MTFGSDVNKTAKFKLKTKTETKTMADKTYDKSPIKLAFHDVDTDSYTDTNILADFPRSGAIYYNKYYLCVATCQSVCARVSACSFTYLENHTAELSQFLAHAARASREKVNTRTL